MAMQDVYTKPFINELSFTNTPDLLYRIMIIVTLKNEDLEPTGAELTHAIAKITNAGTDFLWQILVDSQMQENVRGSLIAMRSQQ